MREKHKDKNLENKKRENKENELQQPTGINYELKILCDFC